ncbi:MAG: DUF2071 domain-containing protein [Phycisphaeraceae bacterium]|nr:DUF2071 domain-containing protein [Phycisphaeraceae bacterium]
MPRPLVTGQFKHIGIVAYAAPKAMIEALLPQGGNLVVDDPHPDLCDSPDSGIVTLVGLSAELMRLWGVRWPGHSSFCELALRVHVRQGDRRGVLHIRRYTSSGLWAWAGVRRFGEDCRKQTVAETVRQQPRTIRVEHSIDFVPPVGVPGPGQVARPEGTRGEFRFTIEASKPVVRPDARGVEHWLKENRWVFTTALSTPPPPASSTPIRGPAKPQEVGGVMVHEVLHPLWSVFPESNVDLRVDFANLFGVDWGFLNGAAPLASVLALGSQVAIFGRRPTVQVRWGQRRGESGARSNGASLEPQGGAIRSGEAAV